MLDQTMNWKDFDVIKNEVVHFVLKYNVERRCSISFSIDVGADKCSDL